MFIMHILMMERYFLCDLVDDISLFELVERFFALAYPFFFSFSCLPFEPIDFPFSHSLFHVVSAFLFLFIFTM